MQNTAGPTILKSPDIQPKPAGASKNPRGWIKSNLVKIVMVVLVIGVLGELVFGGMSLFSPSASRNLKLIPSKVNEVSKARLSLLPEKTQYKNGESVGINVKLFTGGHNTDSTDLVIKYDPSFLKPQGENFLTVGQIYSDYPPVQVDINKGLIGVSGITVPGKGSFSGVGNFAKLNFTALKEGQTQVEIDYQENSTADSNVIQSGSANDILGGVDNANITISNTAAAQNEVSNAQKCSSFTQSCEDSSGTTGTEVCNTGTIKDGVCGYDPLTTVSCEVCKI